MVTVSQPLSFHVSELRFYGEYLLIHYLKVNAANHVKGFQSAFLDCIVSA